MNILLVPVYQCSGRREFNVFSLLRTRIYSAVKNFNQGSQQVLFCYTVVQCRFAYNDWSTPHDKAKFDPKCWDKQGMYMPSTRQCADPGSDDDIMSSIAKIFNSGSLEGLSYSEDDLR